MACFSRRNHKHVLSSFFFFFFFFFLLLLFLSFFVCVYVCVNCVQCVKCSQGVLLRVCSPLNYIRDIYICFSLTAKPDLWLQCFYIKQQPKQMLLQFVLYIDWYLILSNVTIFEFNKFNQVLSGNVVFNIYHYILP